MASAFTHAVAAASIGSVVTPDQRRLVALAAVCSVLPDADVLAFRFGIPYEHMLGHRGLTHSVVFAAFLAAIATWAAIRRAPELPAGRVAAALFLATVSHGVLDALTDGGLGVAFFAPFSGERYFFPWRPIMVSPISVRGFFTDRGWSILASEFMVVWVPAAALWVGGTLVRAAARHPR
jgi:inner membrane protein